MKASNLIPAFFLVLLAFGFAPNLDAGNVRFGPYDALTINSDVIRGVKVDEAGKIWILLNPLYRERELTVKISNENGTGYRKWFTTDDYELVSPANQGKQANQWTDWIETKAPFIEYWMDGQLILHLQKAR